MKKFFLFAIITILTVHGISNLWAEDMQDSITGKVMTKESQASLTSDAALKDLMSGNQRFVSNKLISRDLPVQVKGTSKGQYPKAVILSCIDSRVPVEYVFDQGIGDIFVARVAGNVEDEDQLGSLEYAVGVAGVKVVMVLGHGSCGAVKSAIDKLDVSSENVDHLLAQIEPAISSTKGERNSKDKAYVAKVVKTNAELTIADIRKRSGIIRQFENDAKVKLVAAYYDLNSGKVELIP